MFVDEATISVQAGRGGDGLVSFHREKYRPKGGPDGGDGGDGGNVYIECAPNVHTLSSFHATKLYKAEEGAQGKKNKAAGKFGDDLILYAPPGTKVYGLVSLDEEEKKILLADLVEPGQRALLAKGGKGGRGNVHFSTATHQRPDYAEKGTEGESRKIYLEIQVFAVVGIIGSPNAGKSSLLRVVSASKVEVGNYPFTTLEVALGTVTHKGQSFTMAEIPGLIKGAALGKGLGFQFLRHVRRTKILLHLIDSTVEDPRSNYETIRHEIGSYDPDLLRKEELVVFNKIDLIDQKRVNELKKQFPGAFFISTATKEGISNLLDELIRLISLLDISSEID